MTDNEQLNLPENEAQTDDANSSAEVARDGDIRDPTNNAESEADVRGDIKDPV